MPEVTHLQDKQNLVKTSQYPDYGHWPFENFNPPQSCVFDVFDQDANIGIAAATSAGKTVCAEMYIAHEIRERGGKAMYLGTHKALVQEKLNDWTDFDHHFSDLNISICSGDYQLTDARKKELSRADIITMTSEMLASRCRNFKSEKNNFLLKLGTLVVDECLPEDAQVLTNKGWMDIGKIVNERLDVKVCSFNHKNNFSEFKSILEFSKKLLKRSWVTLYYDGGEITVTNNHKVWIDEVGYTSACKVEIGQKVKVYDKESHTVNERREKCFVGKSSGGWEHSIDESKPHISEVSSESFDKTIRTSLVEVRKIKKNGSNPSEGHEERRIRGFCDKIYNEIVRRLERNASFNLSEQKKKNNKRLVRPNRSSNCLGSVVHGRWKSREKSDDYSHRIISTSGSGNDFKMAKRFMESGKLSLSRKKLLHSKIFFEGKRCISQLGEGNYNSEYEIQTLRREQANDLLFLQKIFSYISEGKINVEKLSLLWLKRLQKVAKELLLSFEEGCSICCDLEIEGNNNFFVRKNGNCSPVLVHNSHLLTVPGRGDHLEVALMKITEINPNIRIVLLSATMPNVVEICEWLSFNLNGKNTYYLNSQYRPCPLDLHYPMYYDQNRRYDLNESSKVDAALDVVQEYPDDKFLIFAHTKKTGESMKSALRKRNIEAEFHNANCSKSKRTQIETDFCNPKKDLRCVIATSTLAWGMNLPARRVIVLGVHRGLTEVDTYDIAQMVGRAGRPKFDKKGDAYILLPQTDVRKQKSRITNPVPITSQLLEHHKILAFHLVSEIHQRTVKTIEDIHNWYSRSLASYQSHDLSYKVDDTLEALMKCGAIAKSDEGVYDVTAVGRIASMFYYSPFDVADLKRNFKGLIGKNKQDDDLWLSMALGNTDSNRTNIVTRADKAAMESYLRKIEGLSRTRPKPFMEAAIKGGFAYYCLLTGNIPPALYSFAYGLKADFDRLIQVLNVVDSFSGQWEMKDWFESLSKRVMYGVKPELMALIDIAEVGKVRAEMLYDKNIRSAADIVNDPQLARAVLNVKPAIFDKIMESAQSQSWKSML